MEIFEMMVASLMVNVCVLIVVIATWMVRRRPPPVIALGLRTSEAGHEEVAMNTTPFVPNDDDHSDQRTSAARQSPVESDTVEVHTMSSIITSSFCSIAGLCLVTSPYIWECPFVSASHSHTDAAVTPHGNNNRLSDNDKAWSRHEAAVTVLLSATFGCVIFALFHLVIVCNRSRTWCMWTMFRAGYLFITLVTFLVIINTKESLLGASLILLMEFDAVIEGICQLIDVSPIGGHIRTARILLSIVGCVVSVGTRIAMTWTLCILLGRTYNPIAMSVISLGISSFGFIFYQAYTLLVIKKHVDQLKTKLGDTGVKKATDNMAVEAYQEKGRHRGGGRAIAFQLMSEGLVEISTYAKTVAGAISGKKLTPMKNLCDSFGSKKAELQAVCGSLAQK